MAIGPREVGEFCWLNILTKEPGEACRFFGTVLGWEFFPMGTIGFGVRVGGLQVGGLFDLEAPATPTGARTILGVMVKVADLDAASPRIEGLGGRAKRVMEIGGQGRMVVAFDPEGAEFDLWEPGTMPGTTIDPHQPGAPRWFELRTAALD